MNDLHNPFDEEERKRRVMFVDKILALSREMHVAGYEDTAMNLLTISSSFITKSDDMIREVLEPLSEIIIDKISDVNAASNPDKNILLKIAKEGGSDGREASNL